MNIKSMTMAAGMMSASALFAATPVVSDVTMSQADTSRRVTISYKLANAPAVVTLDVETNGPNGWVSIGGEHIQRVTGDVWKRVSGKTTYEMVWRPDLDWPDQVVPSGGARARVTAWAVDNTPKYMVVDIAEGAKANAERVRYFPDVEFLPGGLMTNPDYRTTSIVLRRIPAADVEWTMGSVEETNRSSNETTHKVKLGDDYYMGVFQITQKQWRMLTGYNKSYFNRPNDLNDMRPVEMVSYNEVRSTCGKDVSDTQVPADTSHDYPEDPHGDSFLGKLRDRTGLEFDLPSEAQWEFAARAGNGEWRWGDGSLYTSPWLCANQKGRCQRNGGCLSDGSWSTPPADSDETKGTSFVGTFGASNDWGLYDCHGNVQELCLDWYKADITGDNGAVISTPGTTRIVRGGGFSNRSYECRSAYRNSVSPSGRYNTVGVRVCCPMGE